MKNFLSNLLSFLSGVTNVLFGSGGGILAVLSLGKESLEQKKAQATAFCAMLIMSVFSVSYYLYNDYFSLKDAVMYIPFGIPGAIIGGFLLKKLPDRLLKKLFSLFIIWAGLRLIFK